MSDQAAQWSGQGRGLMAARNPAAAEAAFRRALACGETAERLQDLAQARAAQGDLATAKQLYRRALQDAPEDGALHCNFARILFPAGESAAARAELQKAVACDPDYAPGQLFYGIALLEDGEPAAAQAPLLRAVQLMPDVAQAQYHYGLACFQGGDFSAAEAAFQAALQQKPDYTLAMDKLGQCALETHRPDLALIWFRRHLAQQPDAGRALYGCGLAHSALGQYDEAATFFRQAVTAGQPGAALALAGALEHGGQTEAARAQFETLCREMPQEPRAALGLANTLVSAGRLDAAYDAFCRAIRLGPDMPVSYLRLLKMGEKWPLPPDGRATLLDLAARAETLPPEAQADLEFALYHLYSREQLYDRAIGHLIAGNAAKRARFRYDEAQEFAAMAGLMDAAPQNWIAEKAAGGDRSELPVFVIGMPRSGTSLVEQILASHPAVFGAGELSDFAAILSGNGGDPRPSAVVARSADELGRLGARYLETLRRYAPNATRIVNKQPWNFQLVGYIHALLPRARIIHIARDAMDCCFSCFEQEFDETVPFCADLTELGHYYRMYQKMMAHWRTVLPPGVICEVRYETLVTDFEAEARRLIAFCGLDWDPACLRFYQARRSVLTPSATQVRQPVYRSAIGRWQRYAQALTPLSEALAGIR